jgi:hypothetical protein
METWTTKYFAIIKITGIVECLAKLTKIKNVILMQEKYIADMLNNYRLLLILTVYSPEVLYTPPDLTY